MAGSTVGVPLQRITRWKLGEKFGWVVAPRYGEFDDYMQLYGPACGGFQPPFMDENGDDYKEDGVNVGALWDTYIGGQPVFDHNINVYSKHYCITEGKNGLKLNRKSIVEFGGTANYYSGVIDWRSENRKHMLHYVGPRSRNLAYSPYPVNTFYYQRISNWITHNGKNVPTPFSPDSGVYGACVYVDESSGTKWLIVMTRNLSEYLGVGFYGDGKILDTIRIKCLSYGDSNETASIEEHVAAAQAFANGGMTRDEALLVLRKWVTVGTYDNGNYETSGGDWRSFLRTTSLFCNSSATEGQFIRQIRITKPDDPNASIEAVRRFKVRFNPAVSRFTNKGETLCSLQLNPHFNWYTTGHQNVTTDAFWDQGVGVDDQEVTETSTEVVFAVDYRGDTEVLATYKRTSNVFMQHSISIADEIDTLLPPCDRRYQTTVHNHEYIWDTEVEQQYVLGGFSVSKSSYHRGSYTTHPYWTVSYTCYVDGEEVRFKYTFGPYGPITYSHESNTTGIDLLYLDLRYEFAVYRDREEGRYSSSYSYTGSSEGTVVSENNTIVDRIRSHCSGSHRSYTTVSTNESESVPLEDAHVPVYETNQGQNGTFQNEPINIPIQDVGYRGGYAVDHDGEYVVSIPVEDENEEFNVHTYASFTSNLQSLCEVNSVFGGQFVPYHPTFGIQYVGVEK